MTQQRRERLNELLAQRRYSATLDETAAQIGTLLGIEVDPDDALTKEAVAAAQAAMLAQQRYHRVWHRVWGVRLRDEMIETTGRLATILAGERAALVWGHSPPVGFVVPVATTLRMIPARLGPREGEIGPGGIGSDLLLVTDDGESGLLLEYNHLSDADEYEMRTWGRYAVPVAP